MKLRTLAVTNFRCFEALTVEFHPQLTVIVADNGSGKTAILDAIAVGFGAMLNRLPKINGKNFKDTDPRIVGNKSQPFCRVLLETFDDIAWDRNEVRDKSSETKKLMPETIGLKSLFNFVDTQLTDPFNEDKPFVMPVIAYYGTGRGVFELRKKSEHSKKDFNRFSALTGALAGSANFNDLFSWFDSAEDRERRGMVQWEDKDLWRKAGSDQSLIELNAVRKAIEKMMLGFTKPRIEIDPWRFVIDWEKDGIKQTYQIEQLSDGYRMTLAMVMDIARRMAQANPEAENILESEAIILIDEVDLHLHPKWQQTILTDLKRTFKNTQFIVTTHSPQVLTTIGRENIRVLTENAAGEMVAQMPRISPLGHESGDALSYVMQVPVKPAMPFDDDTNTYEQMVRNGDEETQDAQTIKKRLDELGYEFADSDLQTWRFLASRKR